MGNQMSQAELDVKLVEAAQRGTEEQVALLLKSGANPNAPPLTDEHNFLNRTALHHAVLYRSDVGKLELILRHCSDIDVTDDAGNTAMHYAARYRNNAEAVRAIMRRRPNCRIQNSEGKTALHNAVEMGGEVKVMEMLLIRGDADPNIADWDGITPLHVCAARMSVEPMAVGLLLRFGADPNLPNKSGQTALHIAAVSANVSVLLLLRYNAKVRLRDKNGNLPSDLAITEEVRNVLLWEEKRLQDEETQLDLSSMEKETNNAKSAKSYGGRGSIKLLRGTPIQIPAQALPSGASLELSVDRSDVCEGEEEEFYEICLDLKIELPCAFLMSRETTVGSRDKQQPSAFTGMSIGGGEEWKSERELKVEEDKEKTFLHFRLTRHKSSMSVGSMAGSAPTSARSSSKISRPSLSSSSSSSVSMTTSCVSDEGGRAARMGDVADALAEDLSAAGAGAGGKRSREVREDGQVVQEELTARQIVQNKLKELSRSESIKSSTTTSSDEDKDGGRHEAAMADMTEALVGDLTVSPQESHQEHTTDVQAFESDVSIANRNNNNNNNRNLPDALLKLSKRSLSSSSSASSFSSSDESLEVEVGNSQTGIRGMRRKRRPETMSNVVEALLDDLNAKTGAAGGGAGSQQDVEETGVEAFESDVTLHRHVSGDVTRERDEAAFDSLVDQMSIGLD